MLVWAEVNKNMVANIVYAASFSKNSVSTACSQRAIKALGSTIKPQEMMEPVLFFIIKII
jgi:hypothetical protein